MFNFLKNLFSRDNKELLKSTDFNENWKVEVDRDSHRVDR